MKVDAEYFEKLDAILRTKFGVPEIKCGDPTDALVRGILSQNTNDKNRDRAFLKLKNTFADWNAVLCAPDIEVADALRVSGMANQRTARIKILLQWLKSQNNGKIDAQFLLEMNHNRAMELLTSLSGIGIKTAAVFLLFCGGAPFFPVDTHIKRIMIRLGVFPTKTSAEKMIPILSKIIPDEIHYSLHLNLLELGRNICTARKAFCEKCPVKKLCDMQK